MPEGSLIRTFFTLLEPLLDANDSWLTAIGQPLQRQQFDRNGNLSVDLRTHQGRISVNDTDKRELTVRCGSLNSFGRHQSKSKAFSLQLTLHNVLG